MPPTLPRCVHFLVPSLIHFTQAAEEAFQEVASGVKDDEFYVDETATAALIKEGKSVPCGLKKEKHFDGGDALCPEITRSLETEPKINLIGRN